MNTPYPHLLKISTSRIIPVALTALAAAPLSVQAGSGFSEQSGVSSSCNLNIYREAADWSLRNATATAAALSAEGNQGTFGTGELGVAHGLSDALMLKLAVGRSTSQSSTLYNGSTRITGTYVVPELIAAIPSTDLYASVSGYYSSGEAEINRGYLNAGTPEIGRGTPDTQVSALRLRLDWRNALTLGNTAFTPYSSYTHAHSRVDNYSEASGNFPVRWDSHDERTSLIHTGGDARHHLNDSLDLIARFEEVHRMEETSSGSSGQILGLNAFELQGVSYKQDWLRSGLGVEGQVGPGTATVMLNATREGDSPSTWGFASYRLPF